MQSFLMAVLFLSVVAWSSASAATLTYAGSNYTSYKHSGSQANCSQACHPDVSGPYDGGMALTYTLEVDGPLLPHTSYSNGSSGLFLTPQPTRGIRFVSANDGVGEFSRVVSIDILTGSNRLPIRWDIWLGWSSGIDEHRAASTDSSGDVARYYWEIGETCVPVLYNCVEGQRVASESGSASTSANGRWTAEGVIVTPLPASSLLYIGSLLFGFVGLRSRRRPSGI